MIASGIISEIRTGRRAHHAVAGWTAFCKAPVPHAVAVSPSGLDGDEQVNRRYHGGPEKAVYAYASRNYAAWAAEFPTIADRMTVGAMGENLVVDGLDEALICLGDVVRAGSALLQVAQIREPCATLTAMLGTASVARAMVRSGRCGWYMRVLEPGTIAPGDAHAIVERPNPDWSIARFVPIGFGRGGTREALAELATLPGLNPEWQARMAALLARQLDPPARGRDAS